jgi:hypothetical protein
MAYSVILHLPNEEPVLAEMDELPKATDTSIIVSNLRKRDGTRVAYVESETEYLIFPWHRIGFIEIMPSEADREKLIKFFRE